MTNRRCHDRLIQVSLSQALFENCVISCVSSLSAVIYDRFCDRWQMRRYTPDMRASLQLCGLLLYTLCSLVTSQSQERVWHSTSPPSAATDTTVSTPQPLPQIQDDIPQKKADPEPVVLTESVVDPESAGESPVQVVDQLGKPEPDVLNEDVSTVTDQSSENTRVGKKKKKQRKWMSVPSEQVTLLPDADVTIEQPVISSSEEHSEDRSKESSVEVIVPSTLNDTEVEPPKDLPEFVDTEEEEDESVMMEETKIFTKIIYMTITESFVDTEPLFVNLTGIREFTGTERRIVAGCLDLSDLYITGEEAKEVIQRMAKHKFHRIDLSNNNIEEFPSNTFSPVAFTLRELRLDGNPLLSNSHDKGSGVQRGGLFHLTELRELNLSRCGLQDIDLFTPWNSNHLEVVDLSCNNLREVPSNLQFFHKLKKLYLDGNPITKITELPFALLWNLQVLSISSCQVSSITSDPFRNMEHLKELSLEGNNLTRISEVRLSRSFSSAKMYLSSNPWHCACEMLIFIDHYNYAIRDLEQIRCSTPRWLEGLRTAYLTKEILSLDSVDGDCSPSRFELAAPVVTHFKTATADRLELLALVVFVLAAIFMIIHVLWARKKDKYKFDDDRSDINYIRIEKKTNFK